MAVEWQTIACHAHGSQGRKLYPMRRIRLSWMLAALVVWGDFSLQRRHSGLSCRVMFRPGNLHKMDRPRRQVRLFPAHTDARRSCASSSTPSRQSHAPDPPSPSSRAGMDRSRSAQASVGQCTPASSGIAPRCPSPPRSGDVQRHECTHACRM